MGGVHIPHLEAGSVAVEATRSEGRETTLVGEFRQRVGLVHKLAELTPSEEVAHHRTESLRVDELLRGHPLDVHIEEGHALLDQALGAGQAHPALVGQEFAHRTHTTAAQVIDVVNRAIPLLQIKEILDRREEVLRHHDALCGIDADLELLIDLVAAHPGEVVLLGVKEETLEKGPCVGGSGRIPRPQFLVDVLECALLVFCGILAQRFEKNLVLTGIDHLDGLDLEGQKLANHSDGQWIVGPGHHQVLILDVLEEDHGAELFLVHRFAELQFLDLVELLDQVTFARIPEGPQKGGGQEFATTTAAVEVYVEQIVGIKLHLQPGTTIRDDPEGMEDLTVEVNRLLEADPRRAVQLGDDHPLRSIDYEGSAAGHHGQFPHVDTLLLSARFVLQLEGDIESGTESLSRPQGLEGRDLRILDIVGNKIQLDGFIVAGDGEDLLEHGLQTGLSPLGRGDAPLQKVFIGFALNLDEVGRLNNFFDVSEVTAVSHSRLSR